MDNDIEGSKQSNPSRAAEIKLQLKKLELKKARMALEEEEVDLELELLRVQGA